MFDTLYAMCIAYELFDGKILFFAYEYPLKFDFTLILTQFQIRI